MLDEIIISVIGGRGGSGAVSFRREKFVPRGGPDGGDGGAGGAIEIEARLSEHTLDDLQRRKVVRASAGGDGGGAKKRGKRGEDIVLPVPVGTIVWNVAGKERELADLSEDGMRVTVAAGGAGGKGNARLATATRRAPRIAEKGLDGKRVRIRLEVRVLAEAGLVGQPNAGKSSLLRAISAARPKVGAYPFTTLEPYVGVVERGHERLVVADIPGLIEGAHGGVGLGVKFLRHVWRTLVLLLVLDVARPDPLQDLAVVRRELEAFGHGLSEKRWLVALNKIDLPEARGRAAELGRQLSRRGVEAHMVSALTGEGVEQLVDAVSAVVGAERVEAARTACAPVNVLRPRPVRAPKVLARQGGFEVHYARAAETIAKLGLASEEARVEVVHRLRRMGVLSALRRAGAKPGDRVKIGEAELEWPL